MAHYIVSYTARLSADAAATYDIIADYVNGHPHILPPKYFRNLRVEAGGRGAGTRISFQMGAMGQWRDAVGEVTEPEPGRLLHEYYAATDILTTFRVEPVGTGACTVTISTELPGRAGLGGVIERWMMSRFLPRVYREELQLLEARASGR